MKIDVATLALVLAIFGLVLAAWAFNIDVKQQKEIDRMEKVVRARCIGHPMDEVCAEFSVPIKELFE